MDHPAVAQVVTFAMPHDKLGEEVAAAVVLREGVDRDRARDPRLRRRPARRLQGAAPGRDPGRDPKGATGKLQRIGLAEKLGPRRMRICIFGAGAIGGFLGARARRRRRRRSLDRRARRPSRGDRANGLTAVEAAAKSCHGRSGRPTIRRRSARRTTSSSRSRRIGAGRARSDAPAARRRRRPWSRRVNGVPWWYFYGLGGPLAGPALASVDPGDVQWAASARSASSAASSIRRPRVEPGVIEHVEGDRFTLGEPSGDAVRARRAPRRGADRRRPQGAGPAARSATRSGSSSGATCRSTRSAR